MMYRSTIDVVNLTAAGYRAVLDKMGVEDHPSPNIFLHIAAPIEGGFRITETRDDKEAFDESLRKRPRRPSPCESHTTPASPSSRCTTSPDRAYGHFLAWYPERLR